VPLFLFNWDSSFSGTTIFDENWIFFYILVLNLSNFLVCGLYDKPIELDILRIVPSLYSVGQIEKFNLFRNYIFKIAAEGIL
jgi:hypothetical protein